MKRLIVLQPSLDIGKTTNEEKIEEARKEDLRKFEILARNIIQKYQKALIGLARGCDSVI